MRLFIIPESMFIPLQPLASQLEDSLLRLDLVAADQQKRELLESLSAFNNESIRLVELDPGLWLGSAVDAAKRAGEKDLSTLFQRIAVDHEGTVRLRKFLDGQANFWGEFLDALQSGVERPCLIAVS